MACRFDDSFGLWFSEGTAGSAQNDGLVYAGLDGLMVFDDGLGYAAKILPAILQHHDRVTMMGEEF